MAVCGEALAFSGAYEGVEIMKFLDPRGGSSRPQEKYDLSADIRVNDGAGTSVSLLANGFPDSQLFLEKVAAALKARLPRYSDATVEQAQCGSRRERRDARRNGGCR